MPEGRMCTFLVSLLLFFVVDILGLIRLPPRFDNTRHTSTAPIPKPFVLRAECNTS
ncbi:hypothetical protein BJX64DRAFT_263805 [Aspergillus heterothallicus]